MLSTPSRALHSEGFLHDQTLQLSHRICAIRIGTDATGPERFAELAEIEPDCEVLVCGRGYSERTVRILRMASRCLRSKRTYDPSLSG